MSQNRGAGIVRRDLIIGVAIAAGFTAVPFLGPNGSTVVGDSLVAGLRFIAANAFLFG